MTGRPACRGRAQLYSYWLISVSFARGGRINEMFNKNRNLTFNMNGVNSDVYIVCFVPFGPPYSFDLTDSDCPVCSGPVVGQRPEHHPSPAAGPPLVASPYPQSYLQYGQVIQALPPHYHGQVRRPKNENQTKKNGE